MAKGSIFGALEGSRLDLDYEQCLDRCVALWNASVTRDMFSPLVLADGGSRGIVASPESPRTVCVCDLCELGELSWVGNLRKRGRVAFVRSSSRVRVARLACRARV